MSKNAPKKSQKIERKTVAFSKDSEKESTGDPGGEDGGDKTIWRMGRTMTSVSPTTHRSLEVGRCAVVWEVLSSRPGRS